MFILKGQFTQIAQIKVCYYLSWWKWKLWSSVCKGLSWYVKGCLQKIQKAYNIRALMRYPWARHKTLNLQWVGNLSSSAFIQLQKAPARKIAVKKKCMKMWPLWWLYIIKSIMIVSMLLNSPTTGSLFKVHHALSSVAMCRQVQNI